jgi:hypothetical protein
MDYRRATTEGFKMNYEKSQEEWMYDPIRRWLSSRGYLAFTALPKALPKNSFSLDFGVLPPWTSEYKHPDVFAFKWASPRDDEQEIDTLAIECKTGDVVEGIPQAIAYLPFFHTVYIATPMKERDKYIGEVLRKLCCGHISLENNKPPHVQLEVVRNTFFNKNLHHKQVRHRLITFLTFIETFSEKIKSLGGLEEGLLSKTIRIGEASQDDGYITIGYGAEEPLKYLQYTMEFAVGQSADFFINLEKKPAAEVIFQFLRNLTERNTLLESGKVKEFGEHLQRLPKNFYLQLRAERRAVPNYPDCKICLVNDVASEVGEDNHKLSQFMDNLRGIIFETHWLSYMERRIKDLIYMPEDDRKLLVEILQHKSVDKGWRPHLIIGTILWDSKASLTRQEYVSRTRIALSKLEPIMTFLCSGGKIKD